MSKSMLVQLFKKGAELQRNMTFEAFMLCLVQISMRMHDNYDPRSYMHIALFVNLLELKHYNKFVKKMEVLKIGYTNTEIYSCFQHLYSKVKQSSSGDMSGQSKQGSVEGTSKRLTKAAINSKSMSKM